MKKIILVLVSIILTAGVISGWIYYDRTNNQVVSTSLSQKNEQLQNVNKNDQTFVEDINKSSNDPVHLKTYKNEELGFELQYPSEYTLSAENKNWDEEKKSNSSLDGFNGSFYSGELSKDGRTVMQFMFLSKDYRESGGRGGGFSDNNRYVFNAKENKYFLGRWWDNTLQEIIGSVDRLSVGGKEGILIDYNEFLNSRDCVAGYPFPYLASLIKTGWDEYPLLTISAYDVLTDPEKCIFSKPLPDDTALNIINSFKLRGN